VVATLVVGDHPQAVAVDALHNRIYVANVHGDSITAINGETNKVIGTYSAGKNPYAFAIDPTAERVYAANFGQPAVTVVNVSQAAAH
jgi:YVTN family beta-propeller protein